MPVVNTDSPNKEDDKKQDTVGNSANNADGKAMGVLTTTNVEETLTMYSLVSGKIM